MLKTTNYELNIVEGTDLVNPLVVDNPNYTEIDTQMYTNACNSVPVATELKSGSVHALTRINKNAPLFRFTATADFTSGETFTVDGKQVTAYTTNSQPLVTNAYRIGTTVLGCLIDSVLTLFVTTPIATAEDSEKLNGQPAEYYATAEVVSETKKTAERAGTLAQTVNANLNARQNISMSITDTTLTITF